MAAHDRYPGTWLLVPELCLYEEGEPPRSGLYRISQQAGEVSISIAWQAQDGSEHEVEFGGPHDGSRQASESPGATHFSITRVNDSTG